MVSLTVSHEVKVKSLKNPEPDHSKQKKMKTEQNQP